MPLGPPVVLGTERAPLFEASGPVTVRAVYLVNEDTGTGAYEANVFMKPRDQEAHAMLPPNTLVGVEGAVEYAPPGGWTMQAGDRIEGYANVTGVIVFWPL